MTERPELRCCCRARRSAHSCVDEVGRELGRLDGVHAVEADVPRGLLTVRYRRGSS